MTSGGNILFMKIGKIGIITFQEVTANPNTYDGFGIKLIGSYPTWFKIQQFTTGVATNGGVTLEVSASINGVYTFSNNIAAGLSGNLTVALI